MKLLRHAIAGFVILSVLISLSLTIYNGFQENYNFDRGDTKDAVITGKPSGNIMEQLEGLNLRQGISNIKDGIINLKPGVGNLGDILGGITAVATGVIQTIVGLLTLPFEIGDIVGSFYLGEIPGVIFGLVMVIVVYGGFILLSAYLKHDV